MCRGGRLGLVRMCLCLSSRIFFGRVLIDTVQQACLTRDPDDQASEGTNLLPQFHHLTCKRRFVRYDPIDSTAHHNGHLDWVINRPHLDLHILFGGTMDHRGRCRHGIERQKVQIQPACLFVGLITNVEESQFCCGLVMPIH